MPRTTRDDRVSELWRWAAMALATFLAGLLIAGIPFVLRTPTSDEFEQVRDRQGQVLARLAAIDVSLSEQQSDIQDNRDRLDALQELLRDHVLTEKK